MARSRLRFPDPRQARPGVLARSCAPFVAAALLVACSGGGGGLGSPSPSSEDERGAIGAPPTAPEYCTNLGYTLDASTCVFPDGTRCDEWAFYRGSCGQAHSYCNRHGGIVSTKTENKGTYTAVYGVCDLAGKQCDEAKFMQTGSCP